MSEPIGSVHVDVLPRADDFVPKLRARIIPEIGKLGEDAGQEFARRFREPIERDLPQIFPRTRRRTTDQGGKSGKEAGDAFGRELDSRISAAIKALPDITVDAKTGDAEAKIAAIRQQLSDLDRQKIGVDVSDKEALALLDKLRAELEALTGPEHDVRVRINSQAAAAELAKIKAEIEGLDKADLSGKLDKSTKSAGLLALALIGIGPALIPLAATGAVAGAAGAAGVVTLGLAVKGVNAEMKAGTPLGNQWRGMLHALNGDLTVLETTASRAFKDSFAAGVADTQRRMPALTGDVQRIGTLTADAAQHGVAAMFAGFHALDPVIEQVIGDLDRGLIKLQKWADGGGLNGFVAWAQAHLPQVEKDLAQIGEFVAKFLAAEAPQGLTILDVLGKTASLGTDLLHILGPLAPAATDVYLAFALYSKLNAATAGLRAFAAAQAEAAAASGGGAGLRAGAAGVLGRVAPYAAVAAGIVLVANVTTQNMSKIKAGSNDFKAAWYELGHLDFKSFGKGLIGDDPMTKKFKQWQSEIRDVAAARDQLTAEGASRLRVSTGPIATPELSAFQTARSSAYAGEVNNVIQATRVLNRELTNTPLSQAAEKWNGLQTSIQKNVDGVDAFLKLGGPTVTAIDGIAIGENTWHAALAESNGDKAKALGLLQGLTEGIGKNRDEINRLIVDQQRLNTFQTNVADKYKLTTDQVDLYAAALGISNDQIVQSNASEAEAEKIIGKASKQLANGNDALQAWTVSADQAKNGADTLAARANLLAAGLTALQGVTLSMAGTNLTAVSSAEDLASVLDKDRASVGAAGDLLGQLTKTANGYVVTQPRLTKGSLELQQAMAQTGSSAIDLARSIYANTGNAQDALNAFDGLRAQFVSTAEQEGYTATQAENLAKQIFGIPSDAKTFVKLLGKDDVAGAIRDLTGRLGHFADIIAQAVVGLRNAAGVNSDLDVLNAKLRAFEGTHTATFVLNDGSSGSGGKTLRRATGGWIQGPGTETSDSIPILASHNEFVVNARQAKKHRALLESINSGVRGYASGGSVLPSLLVPVTKAASGPSASSVKAQSNRVITIGNVDISKFLRSLANSASAIESSERTLVNAVTAAGGGPALAKALSNENNTLVKLADHRDALTKRLAAANTKLAAVRKQYTDEVTKVSGTITGAFDITSAGYSPEQILATLTKDENTAALFKQQLAQVNGLGLSKTLQQQLAEKGLDAEPELLALSRASKSQIGAINSGYANLGSIGKGIGTETAQSLYGAGVSAAQGLVAGLRSQRAAIEKEMRAIADAMVAQIKKSLKISSPSQVARELGAYVGEGMALGVRDSHDTVRAAADHLASGALPRGPFGRGNGYGMPPMQIDVHPAPGMNEEAIAEATARRVFARSA